MEAERKRLSVIVMLQNEGCKAISYFIDRRIYTPNDYTDTKAIYVVEKKKIRDEIQKGGGDKKCPKYAKSVKTVATQAQVQKFICVANVIRSFVTVVQ